MVDRQRFLRELPGWMLRGAACALPSAWFAIALFGYRPALFVGIFLGFALVVAAFAAACSRLAPEGRPWERALRTAAWVRAGLGIPCLYLDALTGALCVSLFDGSVSKEPVFGIGARQFAQVFAVTLAQGALVALEVFLIAALLLLTRLVRSPA